MKPAPVGSGLLRFWILVPSMVQVLLMNATPVMMWGRDAITYLLISAGVVIGVDDVASLEARSSRPITSAVVIVAVGGLAI